MIKVIKEPNIARCEDCNILLSYENKDVEVAWNYNRTRQVRYIRCPKCEEFIVVKD